MYVLVGSVDELWLRGDNRPTYVRLLKEHLEQVVSTFHQADFKIRVENHHHIIESSEPFSATCVSALLKVPGLHDLHPAEKVPQDIEAIEAAVLRQIEAEPPVGATFASVTKRSIKSFPLTSEQINRRIGGVVLERYPHLKVDLNRPDFKVHVRIFDDSAYTYTKTLPGIGGLPACSSGHLVTLLSGGIDSPVASYLMSRRGCAQTLAFFYAYPFVGAEVKDKIVALAKVLRYYQRSLRLYVLPYGDVQKEIAKVCNERYRTLLFRYFMYKTAALLARIVGADGLVTGDVLSQVSSQTIHNIALLDKAVDLPILRPLIGYRKEEIITVGKTIGTYPISILPHDDACALFAAKRPIINPNLDYWQSILADLSLDPLLQSCVAQAEIHEISC